MPDCLPGLERFLFQATFPIGSFLPALICQFLKFFF
jgi:hypothetical protein